MNQVFMIEHLWMDSLENNVHAAYGYEPKGFVETEEEAKALVAAGGFADPAACWALDRHRPTPKVRYKKLTRLK